MEQIQYCAKFPAAGLRVDCVRLDSIEMDDWQTMCHLTNRFQEFFPVLTPVLASPLSIHIERAVLADIREELETFLVTGPAVSQGLQQLLTFSLFVDQVLDQPGAIVSIEHWPGRYFEGQVFIFPGTDLLARLASMPVNRPVAQTARAG